MILNDLWMGGMAIRRYLNWKVIASILFFPLVLRIEFKSAEELKLQPKTHEEHLATQNESNDDDDDDDDDDYDSEDFNSGMVSHDHSNRRISDEKRRKYSSKLNNDTSIEFILENKHIDNQSIEMKPINDQKHESLINLKQTDDINDINIDTSKKTEELINLKDNIPIKSSTIPITERFYEFYNAPITKFWYNAIFYVFFLFLFTYMVLVRTPPKPSIAGKYC
jgi:hypothetical protein